MPIVIDLASFWCQVLSLPAQQRCKGNNTARKTSNAEARFENAGNARIFECPPNANYLRISVFTVEFESSQSNLDNSNVER